MTTHNVHRNGSSASRSAFYLLLVLGVSSLCLPVLSAGPATPVTKKLKPTDSYALIFGTVWGPDNRPVYGVKVSIRRMPDKKPKWEVYSDHAGEFAQRVPAGEADYQIVPDLKNLKTSDGHTLHLAQEVTVHVEYDERVDMSLHLTH